MSGPSSGGRLTACSGAALGCKNTFDGGAS